MFPSSEIYGGFRSTWDYGPLGVELKRNVKDAWWKAMVHDRDDIVGLDAAILMAPKVWEASGHLATFTDPLVDCTVCQRRFRLDQLEDRDCPNCGPQGLPVHRGPPVQPDVQDVRGPGGGRGGGRLPPSRDGPGHLRELPERPDDAPARSRRSASPRSASRSATRSRPGNFVYRTREFEQMEMEYFVPPDEGARWFEYWCADPARLVPRPRHLARSACACAQHETEELSHYSAGTADVEYEYPWGWGELEGIANRTDYDLKQHSQFSGEDLSYFDQETRHPLRPPRDRAGRRRRPGHARVPARRLRGGGGQGARSGSCCASTRAWRRSRSPCCRCRRRSACRRRPARCATSSRSRFVVDYDEAGSIGRRYRRQDEVGTPLCVTVDFETIDDRGGHRARARLDGPGARRHRPVARLPGRRVGPGALAARPVPVAPWTTCRCTSSARGTARPSS